MLKRLYNAQEKAILYGITTIALLLSMSHSNFCFRGTSFMSNSRSFIGSLTLSAYAFILSDGLHIPP